MTLDLIIRNATLPDGRTGIDIACAGGRIVALEPNITGEAARVIEASGRLVSPPFVDCHFHMDATLSLGTPRLNQSGTLLEGIALWGELKPFLTVEAVIERALRYCDLAVRAGSLPSAAMSISATTGCLAVDALLEVKRRIAPTSTSSSSPSRRTATTARRPRRRISSARSTAASTWSAASRISSAPWPTVPRASQALCAIAEKRGLMVDMHCDESDDPLSRHIETLAAETRRLGLAGRVTGSHLTSMHSMDNYYVSKLLPLIAEAGVHAVANPLINIVLQGRHDTYPKRRGQTRVPEMRAYGHQRRLRPGLHHGPLVLARRRRHARRRPYGPPCRPAHRAARRCASASRR